jgi:hypothetical protein
MRRTRHPPGSRQRGVCPTCWRLLRDGAALVVAPTLGYHRTSAHARCESISSPSSLTGDSVASWRQSDFTKDHSEEQCASPKPIVQLRQQRRQGCSHGRSALKCRSLSWRDNCSERPRVLPARRGSVRRAETERDVRAVTGGQEVPGSSPGSPTTCQFRDLGGTIHGASFFVGTAFVYEFSTNDLDRGQGPTAHVVGRVGRQTHMAEKVVGSSFQ